MIFCHKPYYNPNKKENPTDKPKNYTKYTNYIIQNKKN